MMAMRTIVRYHQVVVNAPLVPLVLPVLLKAPDPFKVLRSSAHLTHCMTLSLERCSPTADCILSILYQLNTVCWQRTVEIEFKKSTISEACFLCNMSVSNIRIAGFFIQFILAQLQPEAVAISPKFGGLRRHDEAPKYPVSPSGALPCAT